ncbi:hypothetical protein GCM10011608_22780 [Micromonospora sonchi]|uniref:Alpha-L-arabinofuranosidase B arabinose-binding domain-containing protein n=1 Tax=Micromonospora sonchi TaxID=1763543 RepID=A0A917TU70_9ACTN|nr:AbfB domain-containing protein [Micromonospora sonchi]GGM37649.1 hypothetical protein GCM10011608_22780 [Micromonospora sonchi]
MSQHGNGQSHLRIGGWLPGTDRPGSNLTPPASGGPDAGTQQHRPTESPQRTIASPPVTSAAPPVTSVAPSAARRPDASAEAGQVIGRAAPRRVHVLGGVALVVVTALVGVMALRDGNPQESIRGEFVAEVLHPDPAEDNPANDDRLPGVNGPGSDLRGVGAALPSPSTDAVVRPGLNPRTDGGAGNPGSGPATPGGTPANPATKAPPPAPSAPANPSSAPASPAGSVLVPGTRIGLEVASLPGHRVRHANFEVRVEPVNAASSAGTKADAAFVVRSGLAGSSCVSFESVNFPGHYLRHSGFRVFLHRADGSALFRADATFCPVTGIGGTHTSLRSHNYPDRYLSRDPGKQMRVSPIGEGAAPSTATFLIRPAL